MQINLVDVTFRKAPKTYTFNALNFDLQKGDHVVVETTLGQEIATAACASFTKENPQGDFKPILRKADAKDLEKHAENQKKEIEMKNQTEAIVKRLKLPMKVVSVELSLSNANLLVNFTSESRVDFRDLLRELSSQYKMKIELRQIGSRDETRIMGGLGACGKVCCCKQFLNDFEHVTIKMAKVQNLSLNPTKISGICGRLMCCLGYENDYYTETSKLMPRIGSEVFTPDGKGIVAYNNLLKRKVTVNIPRDNLPSEQKEYDFTQIKFNRPNSPKEDEGSEE